MLTKYKINTKKQDSKNSLVINNNIKGVTFLDLLEKQVK